MLGKTPESFFDSNVIKSGNLKEHQLWIFTGGTDTEVEAPVFWSSDVNRWLTEKVPDAGKDGRQKETRVSEDEIAGWYTDAINMNLGKLQEMEKDREV